jgi:ATP-dependent helicase YprA (DUF1998 family)
MAKTIQESISELHISLAEYIEATYHIGNEGLIGQRRSLLNEPGVIHQSPYLESTPRYAPGPLYEEIAGLPAGALQVYQALSRPSDGRPALFYNPPYQHQADAIRNALVRGKNLIIMTGTGSGKTESFLLPILGGLAREASERPESFGSPAVRAILLYPMNALVNDQIGRLRSLFSDPRLGALFNTWAGRRPRFGRYTSRTPYAGVRSGKKDQRKLKSFGEFFVEMERAATDPLAPEQEAAEHVRQQLRAKGKWPGKPSLQRWFGSKNAPWEDRRTGEFLRAVALPEDAELLTRDEIQQAAPDLLVANYSMLEYMLMRPIERPIFNQTRDWLAANPKERLMVVLDEAHLYRGAAGAEVGLLIRRLRERLGIDADRIQIIGATASFNSKDEAPSFGAQLSGCTPESFEPVTSTYALRPGAAEGTEVDAQALANLDLMQFYAAADEEGQTAAVAPFLKYRGDPAGGDVEAKLFDALKDFPALAKLVNITMGHAQPITGLGKKLFPGAPSAEADHAVTALLALGSRARRDANTPGLLPCRVHTFFRGLPGLWVCMDPDCTQLPEAERGGPCGKMYSQPRERCGCESRVLEFYTCRNCGGSYARAYSDDVENPNSLWSRPGRSIQLASGHADALEPLDLLLETPPGFDNDERIYDLETGRLDPSQPSARQRSVWLRPDRHTPTVDEEGNPIAPTGESRGQFVPCGLCNQRAGFNKSSVQDHQTKGDQPFQTLLSRQIHIQPPGPEGDLRFAPLRGRKVLVFSDSRQVAARLAPNLQMYSVRDALRPLLVWGFDRLKRHPYIAPRVQLSHAFFAVLLAAKVLGVRLRPELAPGESFDLDGILERAFAAGELDDDDKLQDLWLEHKDVTAPRALLDEIHKTIRDNWLGLEALALASVTERPAHKDRIEALPNIPVIAETPEGKRQLVRAWLHCWMGKGIWFEGLLWGNSVRGHSGNFEAISRLLGDATSRRIFREGWLPVLRTIFLDDSTNPPRLAAKNLSIEIGGDFVRCQVCKSVHRPLVGVTRCEDCKTGTVIPLDIEKDEVFAARKAYYRRGVNEAMSNPPSPPMAIIAAEHTAQLNAAQNAEAFSKAEENELLFQDIDIVWRASAKREAAVDILSSTTTMEVGIDIGALSGVALRNMPPGRANYQQRAGRAGRRGNAVATVVAFGSSDSHDEHYFRAPAEMISGPVVDPKLTLNNPDIVKRHVYAYLLQRYHQDRLPEIEPEDQPDLFSVLGTVANFRTGAGLLNRNDFVRWMSDNAAALRARVAVWIPKELAAIDREELLAAMFDTCRDEIDKAIEFDPNEPQQSTPPSPEDGDDAEETDPVEEGEEQVERDPNRAKLLDRLLYNGVLPRYAFPTDVAAFHVFDRDQSTGFRPIFKFTPAQGLPVALSQYAPGRQVWISGKCYTSGAIYSQSKDQSDRRDAWTNHEVYFQCQVCGFAKTGIPGARHGDVFDCEACGSAGTFGPGMRWMRPVGFAHRINDPVETSPDNVPESSRATRAKLTMSTPGGDAPWASATDRLKGLRKRTYLLVSNTGPDGDGYAYCTHCGCIEASNSPSPLLGAAHDKPYPTKVGESICDGGFTARRVVLGTNFITDIALFSMGLSDPLKLKPGWYSTDVALRTVSEALALAACRLLEIEPGEILAEYRPALTPGGPRGMEAEIFLYDTLPGGAGFTSQLPEKGELLFRAALDLLRNCEGHCDSSCYRCLRSYKNKFEHGMLDRHLGADLVAYLLDGTIPALAPERVERSNDLLWKDLVRRGDTGVVFERDRLVSVAGVGDLVVPILATRKDGRKFAIALSGSLTPDFPISTDMRRLVDVGGDLELIVADELMVRMNLPAATLQVSGRLT